MNTEHWEKHKKAYCLYLRIVPVLIGEDPEIALLALSKCKVNLIMAQNDLEDQSKNKEKWNLSCEKE